MLGDKSVIFSLSVNEFTDDTLGTYALTVTSKDGGTTVEVPEIRVTNRGMYVLVEHCLDEHSEHCLVLRCITGLRHTVFVPLSITWGSL